ncbi:hypothetical protein GBAR_LOCUS2698 [Geodia barretti]|uniref:Uncharacterized protein n=1 Tax=Geodia barretti TaxID=519541 RepID=A0AA35R0G3_GEOBA|nr:hypothetical protein GBAR_LOCUS2698 [Geodia barretti]
MSMLRRIGVKGREKYQQVSRAFAGDSKGVLSPGRNDHGVVSADSPGFAIHADFQRSFQYDDKLVYGVSVQRSAGARLGGIDAKGAGYPLFVARHVPLSVARPLGHLRSMGMVNNGHSVLQALGQVVGGQYLPEIYAPLYPIFH